MDKLFDSAKETLSKLSEGATNLMSLDVLSSVKEYGLDKLNEAWSQIDNSSDVFSRTGYSITSIDIDLAIPPVIKLNLEQETNISDEEEEKLLEENKGKTILYPILLALFKANAVQKSINSVQYKLSGIMIGLGLSPCIEMKFKKINP